MTDDAVYSAFGSFNIARTQSRYIFRSVGRGMANVHVTVVMMTAIAGQKRDEAGRFPEMGLSS
ncbi:hypothetical protein HMPREF9949_1479 [Propionibacterium sp. CC003-HC2]|nr:hypothetical protein HMPREF9949_1479 [Propionibacterium sp. CC003-HC2]